MRLYAFFQFVCATLATTGLLVVSGSWAPSHVGPAVLLLGFSFYTQSLFAEGRKRAVPLECLKLALAFYAANTLPVGPRMHGVIMAYVLCSIVLLASINVPRFRALAGGS